MIKLVLFFLFGLAAGSITAAGFFSVMNSVGLINRVAAVTKTKSGLLLYEEFSILGAIAGVVFSLLPEKHMLADISKGSVLYMAVLMCLVIYGLLAGAFVGLLVVSIAETTKALPIFMRRVRVARGLGVIILMVGLGKAVGHLVYYLILYTD